MSFALSTSWNASRYEDAQGLVAEIKSLGFKEIELSFNLTRPIIEGINNLRRQGQIEAVSAHNFCPIPDGLSRQEALPDYYSMSSLDERVRQEAVKYSKISIDTASGIGAKVVVLHCGRVEMPDYTRQLLDLYLKRDNDSAQYRKIKSDFIRQRKELVGPFFENTLKSLKELVPYAASREIMLGIENRFYYREIPSLEETGVILDAFRGKNVFYWHDTGHAQIMGYLGFGGQKEFLELYAKDMIGMHIHDVYRGQDHHAPSKGELDFASLKPYLTRETLKVVEVHSQATDSDLKESKRYLEALWDGKV